MRSTLLAVAALLVAVPASAQGPAPLRSGYVNLNFLGFQGQSQEFPVAGAFPLYGEDARFEVVHEVKGGPLFDVGGGVRVWNDLSAGLSFSRRFKDTRDATVATEVPSPIFTDAFRSATGTATGLGHSERAVHLHAVWRVPLTEEFDVSVSFGPSFFTVERDVVESITVAEVGGDFSAVNISGITTRETSDTGTGVNIGVDGTYMFTRQLGGGVQMRFSRASVSLPLGGDNNAAQLDTGGFEIAAGVRFRF